MTAMAETMEERDEGPVAFHSSLVVRAHVLVSVAFLLVGLGLYGLAAAKLVWPDLLGDSATFTYGRVLPAGSDALLFGWLTIALLGFAMHAVPRLSGRPLVAPLAALGSLGLIAAGTAWGTLEVLAGHNAGGLWLEFPLVADGALLAGAFVAAAVLTITARGAGRLPVAGWYLVAAPWWLVFSLAVGAVPVYRGLPADVQAAFTGAALLGLWVVASGIGAAYHVVYARVAEARFHPLLGQIGFWSLAFAWAWTAGRVLQYGPTNDWYETLPVVFGAGLVLAVITIITDLVQAMRGHWQEAASAPVRLITAGLGFLAAGSVVGFVGSLRSVSAVVGLTPWESGYTQIVIFGIGTLLVFGALAHALPGERGRVMGSGTGWALLGITAAGVIAAAGSRLVAGLQQGYAWLAGVQSQAFDNFGAGFGESLRPLRGAAFVQVGGLALIAVGALLFALFSLRHAVGRSTPASPVRPVGGSTAPVAVVLRGAVALFAVAALGAFLFPAIDSHAPSSMAADASHGSASATIWDRGQDLYLSEGCWYCHSRDVRPIVTDLGLGAISTAGDYAYDDEGLIGVSRGGPDLAHFGARDDGGVSALIGMLGEPGTARHAWSTMPSYRYLSDADIAALAAYVAGLE